MKVRELRQWLAKFDDDLPVVFCSEKNDQLTIFTVTHICEAEASIRSGDDGNLSCNLGKSPISEKHLFIDIEPSD
ncbi:MAG: hypothetical protein WBQ69_05025 [Gallionella sp.]